MVLAGLALVLVSGMAVAADGTIAFFMPQFIPRRDGRFDPREVAMIIDGRDARLVSSQRQMPIWGDLHAHLRARSAELGEGMSEEMDALVAWIESIQLAR